jgi:hypothetical protein
MPITLYTYEINLPTGKIEESVHVFDDGDYDESVTGYASYNDDGWENVYAESLVSAEDAKLLVLNKCKEFVKLFTDAALKIAKS